MNKGCFYWLLIGWWLDPFMWIMKITAKLFYWLCIGWWVKLFSSKTFWQTFLPIIAVLLIIGALVAYWPVAIAIVALWLLFAILGGRNKYSNADLDNMSGHEFEHFCAKVLKSNGFHDVKVTPGSGDHGIDVLAKKNGVKYAFQCKHYSNKVGNKAIQEAYSGKAIYGANVAAVMTNNFFTKQAIDDAETLDVQLFDRNDILRMSRPVKKEAKKARKKTDRENNVVQHDGQSATVVAAKEKPFPEKDKASALASSREKIVVIKDKTLCNLLFNNLDANSRIAVDKYLKTPNDNIYTSEMIQCAEMPIMLYNAKYHFVLEYLHFTYYCPMSPRFKETNAYKKLNQSRDFDCTLFKIDVFYKIDDIVLLQKDIEIQNDPEINIWPSNMEDIELVESVDDGEIYIARVTPDCFFIRGDNFQFQNNGYKIEERNLGDNYSQNDDDLRQDEVNSTYQVSRDIERFLQDTMESIVKFYGNFGVSVSATSIEIQKSYVVFGVKPCPGVRAKNIISCRDDLSLELRADLQIRLVSNKGYIGVFVPIGELYKHFSDKVDGFNKEKVSTNLADKPSTQAIDNQDRDPFLMEAGRLVTEDNKASVGMLQRYFKINFMRAAKLIDDLCDMGVIEGTDSATLYKVLMSKEQFEKHIKDRNC